MKENRTLTAEEKLALVQLIGISNTINDVRRHISSYLEINIDKEETPPTKEVIIPKEEVTSVTNAKTDIKTINDKVNIGDASIYDSKYLDIVKEDLAKQKSNTDKRKTEIVNDHIDYTISNEPTIEDKVDISANERHGYLTEEELFGSDIVTEKSPVLEKKINPWEGLRTVTPGDSN